MSTHISAFIKHTFVYGIFTAFFLAVSISIVLLFLPSQPEHISTMKETTSYPPPALSTQVWGVFDPSTGKIVAGDNIDTVRPIASITKLFTAEAVLLSPHKDEIFKINYEDVWEEGKAGKLVYGTSVTPYRLLYPLLLESSNDAAHAITRHLGNDYTALVSSVTNTLALEETVIRDGSGLSPDNVSTVRELSTYYAHLRVEQPHILDITKLKMFINGEVGYINNDPAVAVGSFTGGKHGFTDEANRTFIGTFARADGDEEFGVVLLGSGDLRADIDVLVAYGENITGGSDIMSQ